MLDFQLHCIIGYVSFYIKIKISEDYLPPPNIIEPKYKKIVLLNYFLLCIFIIIGSIIGILPVLFDKNGIKFVINSFFISL